jgi:tetratricopeptide (TPR) repeat protein
VLRQSHASDPRAAYLEALVLERRGDARGARSALSRVTDLLDPAPMEFYRYRPQMLILGGLAHHGLVQFEKAKPYLEAAQRQQPTSPAAKVLAQIQINDGNLDRTTETLEAYLQGNPRDAQAYVLLAGAHQARGRAARAVQILSDAQKRHDTPALRGALGLALVSVGRGAEALPHLEQAVKADPKQVQAARTLGDLYLQRRDPARARTVADTLVRRDAKDPQAHLLLGRVHLAQASAAPAEASFRQALAIDPSL